jgi:tannase
VNATIIACDSLDGRTDGVVSRTDLCSAHFDISTVIGTPYYCAATIATARSGATPVQNGTVTTQAIAVAKKIFEGLHDSEGRRAYFTYTPSSAFTDAQTAYNPTTGQWGLSVTSLGGSFVEVLLDLQMGSNLPNLNNVTYDTLVEWIWEGWNKYNDVLMTNWPDLTAFKNSGGKVIHFHGESGTYYPYILVYRSIVCFRNK